MTCTGVINRAWPLYRHSLYSDTGDNKRPPKNVKICQTSKCHRCHKSRGSVPLACWNSAAECWDVPFVHLHDVTHPQDNARSHVIRICTQLLETEHVTVLGNVSHYPEMSITSHCPQRRVGQYSTSHSCNRQPGGVNAQAMYCTAICHWRTCQILSDEYRILNPPPHVLMVLFGVHWISLFVKCFNSVTWWYIHLFWKSINLLLVQ